MLRCALHPPSWHSPMEKKETCMTHHADLAPLGPGSLTGSFPPVGTLEAWALSFLAAETLEAKFALPEPPRRLEPRGPPQPDARPSRPSPLVVSASGRKTPGHEALRAPGRRAELMHAFLHHEL